MFRCVQNYMADCEICAKCKADSINPKAPLIPVVVPESPMEFVSFDIAHMEPDAEGYRYLLLMGDVFSKYIEAVPLKEQSSANIIHALWNSWITKNWCPMYMLSDQGGNYSADLHPIFHKEKKTLGYHSQGNGFAERNIWIIRQIMRTLLENKLPQSYW